MTLAASQRGFLADISASDDAPAARSPGMAIYRNAYRARLSDALATSFDRTRRWVGDAAFAAASAHYIITHPPQSWTLDAYGDRFVAVLAELFAQDAEVAKLAWLSRTAQKSGFRLGMHHAFDRPYNIKGPVREGRMREIFQLEVCLIRYPIDFCILLRLGDLRRHNRDAGHAAPNRPRQPETAAAQTAARIQDLIGGCDF